MTQKKNFKLKMASTLLPSVVNSFISEVKAYDLLNHHELSLQIFLTSIIQYYLKDHTVRSITYGFYLQHKFFKEFRFSSHFYSEVIIQSFRVKIMRYRAFKMNPIIG